MNYLQANITTHFYHVKYKNFLMNSSSLWGINYLQSNIITRFYHVEYKKILMNSSSFLIYNLSVERERNKTLIAT